MFSTMDTNKEAHLSSYVCGYYIYNAIWSVTVREELQYAREVGNAKDGYTISIIQGSDVVEHLWYSLDVTLCSQAVYSREYLTLEHD